MKEEANNRKEHWFVLYTKSRQEKNVSKILLEKGIEAYCPIKRTKHKWSDRWKWVEMPLFNSYCFVRLAEEDKDIVFEIPGVVQFVYWLGKPGVVRDGEIEKIKTWLNDFDHELIEIEAISIGDKVTIDSGPLMEEKGELVSRQGSKLQLRLENLGVLLWVDAHRNKITRIAS
ncbi:MAG: UpxY family transcription antiterminator [Bacteroidetes bacterium]|nr:UpxY family transcription antiterminator [Bacteroidota bacterium]MDA1120837.1 UpxY family transcription antiterminator [Bacteroidota bacterium]